MEFLKGRGCRSSGEKSEGLCSSSVGRVEEKKDPTQPHSKVLCSRREKDLQNQGARGNLALTTWRKLGLAQQGGGHWQAASECSEKVQHGNAAHRGIPKLEGPGMHWECSWHN